MKNKIAISMLLFLLVLSSCVKKTRVPEDIRQYISGADFIFAGTIQLLNTSTINAEDPKSMAVVKVDKIISSSDDLRGFEGQQITVHLKDAASAKQDEKRIFFTRASWFGESIGVDEIGSISDTNYQKLDEQIKEVGQENEDARLTTRLKSSELVISGRVISVRRSPTQSPFVSEHNPEWNEAEIEVSGLFKGSDTKKITVLFPGSEDELYMESPKYKVGDSGIFLLRKGNTKLADEKMFSIVHKQDFLNINQSERIKSLIRK